MPGTDLEQQTAGLPAIPDEEAAKLAAEIQGEASAADLSIPQLKLVQGSSDEAKRGLQEPGDFINGLTGESFGTEVEFIVGDQFKGRFLSREDGTGAPARGDTVPWSDHPCYGSHFADCPDAEEQYKLRVDAGEIEWGKGPEISTTFNFVGYVVGEQGSSVPVNLSLMRTGVPAARKLQTFTSRLSKAPWSKVYKLTRREESRGRHTYFVIDVEVSRDATPGEQQAAIRLAQQTRQANASVEYQAEDAAPKPDAPAPEGGLEV